MASWVRGKCIGKGAFGTVSVGVDKSDGRVFAVKSADLNTGLRGQLEALENEIRILRGFSSSPYVVGFLGDDVTCEGGATTSYRNLHLEYLPGGTLADLASRNARRGDDLDERLVRYYTWCMVNALRHVHSMGVVHCDVKGRNVLVGPNGCVVKLADFGSAMEFSREGGAMGILPRGSPLWMAPEVIRRESQGPESDVWSLGCTVIEMVNGKPAWEDHGADTLSRIGYSDYLPDIPTQLSELGRDFLEKCLRREPKQRWSCDQLLQHPFLCSASPNKVVDSSPRCVLDWVNSEFAEEDEDEEIRSDAQSSAKERIGKLDTNLRANWETEGWVAVRGLASETEPRAAKAGDGGSGSEDEGEGTSWEYPGRVGAEEGMEVGTSWEYSDSKRTAETERANRENRENWEMGGRRWLVWRRGHRVCNGCIAGWSCRYGSETVHLELWIRGIIISIYSMWCKLLKSDYINLWPIYLNILFFWTIYIPYLLSWACDKNMFFCFRRHLCYAFKKKTRY